MSQARTSTVEFDPEKLFHQMEEAGAEYAEARYTSARLEKLEKVLLAKLQLEWQRSGHSVASSITFALADPKYEKHLEGMHIAQRESTLAWAHYENLKAYVDLIRTREASARHMIHNSR